MFVLILDFSCFCFSAVLFIRILIHVLGDCVLVTFVPLRQNTQQKHLPRGKIHLAQCFRGSLFTPVGKTWHSEAVHGSGSIQCLLALHIIEIQTSERTQQVPGSGSRLQKSTIHNLPLSARPYFQKAP